VRRAPGIPARPLFERRDIFTHNPGKACRGIAKLCPKQEYDRVGKAERAHHFFNVGGKVVGAAQGAPFSTLRLVIRATFCRHDLLWCAGFVTCEFDNDIDIKGLAVSLRLWRAV
jgi:hypothetical protein